LLLFYITTEYRRQKNWMPYSFATRGRISVVECSNAKYAMGRIIGVLSFWTEVKDMAATCEVKLRDSGVCGGEVANRVFTPFMTVKFVCANCARLYATVAGFVVKPLEDPPPGLVCWCGAAAKIYRFDGLVYHLCLAHRPLDLSVLWRRLWWRMLDRIRRLFVRPKPLTSIEVQDLVERAHKRARALKRLERMPP
jgi:hypothetical protein